MFGRLTNSFQSTPTCGRRLVLPVIALILFAFQSTPPCGRRRPAHRSPGHQTACFNPRLRAGGDPHLQEPTSRRTSFNPRLRAGGDCRTLTFKARPSWFQSTPPCGRRHLPADELQPAACFNPRLRAGGDSDGFMISTPSMSFNPRLRAGGDVHKETGLRRCRVSIHASVREATWA